uniref:Transcriptional activator protein n=1 Tax=Tomato leaf curl Palampur virus TaxID=526476 RepID=A0A5J6RDI7_9GEMI|nr:transcriptional activator [Tomato leaf curl Palampur virus]
MHSSLHSRDHSTPVAKTSRPKKKKKNIRRRRVDLQCGCSYYISITCHDHGFGPREIHPCGPSKGWREFLDRSNSPVFHHFETPQETLPHQPRHYNSPNTVQPQPEESTGASQVFSNIPDLDGLTPSDWAFLESFQNPGP